MYKKIILVLIVLTLCFSFVIYKSYNKTLNKSVNVYILQVGAYKEYDNVLESAQKYENYLIRKEGDLYKLFIGVTKDETVYDKLLAIYLSGEESFKKILKVNNEEFEQNLTIYDNLIKNTDNKESINLVIKSSLSELESLLNEKEV